MSTLRRLLSDVLESSCTEHSEQWHLESSGVGVDVGRREG